MVNRNIAMIKFHRRRKNLCEICGMDEVNHPNNKYCIENYEKADMRNNDVIKCKSNEHISNNEIFIENPFDEVKSIQNINIENNHIYKNNKNDYLNIPNCKYIIIDITKSYEGYGIKFELIKFLKLNSKSKTYIIGDFNQYPSFFKLQLERTVGILTFLNDYTDDIIENYILHCHKFYYLNSSKYKQLVIDNNIKGDVFETNGKEDIGLEIVKQNANYFM